MKNGNGKDYANKHPDESKSSEVASVLGKPIGVFKKFQENIKRPLGKPLTTKEKEELKKKSQGIIEPKFIDKL